MYTFLIASLIVRPRRASFLFVLVATLFQELCSNLDGSIYFFLAAFCDFIVAGVLYHFGTSRKSLDMMLISIISMSINLTGWLLWFFLSTARCLCGNVHGAILCGNPHDTEKG